jgi:hypothetical protein
VLLGEDVATRLEIPRAAAIFRNRQILLNLILRHAFVFQGVREEQMARIVADTAPPLRACAAALAELNGGRVDTPRAALEAFAATLPERDWPDLLGRISEARDQAALPPGTAADTLLRLVELAGRLRDAFDTLSRQEASR